MEELKEIYRSHYSSLWTEFINKIKSVDVVNCPEPHLPVYGEFYASSSYKIAFIGLDTIGACNLEIYNKEEGHVDLLNDWKTKDFDNLGYLNWAWKYNFWRFIFKFLSEFYNLDIYNAEVEKLRKGESDQIKEIFKSFVWGNVMSIERFEVTAKGKGVREDNWLQIKKASVIFDKANNIVKVFSPNVMIVLYWDAPQEWFTDGFNEFKGPEILSDHLWYYFIKDTSTHIFWTKHPRVIAQLNHHLDKIIINDILLAIKNKLVFNSFPGKNNLVLNYNHSELIEKLKNQVDVIAKELSLQFYFSEKYFGKNETGFYFFRPEWEYFRIGFEFECKRRWANNFFYGICRNPEVGKISEQVYNPILIKMGKSDEEAFPEYWPWWKWFEHRNWSLQTFAEIENGDLIKKIKLKVEEILTKLKGEVL